MEVGLNPKKNSAKTVLVTAVSLLAIWNGSQNYANRINDIEGETSPGDQVAAFAAGLTIDNLTDTIDAGEAVIGWLKDIVPNNNESQAVGATQALVANSVIHFAQAN
jgi:hypothetical protein